MKRFPETSTAIPVGPNSRAEVAGPPSPEKSLLGLPAILVMIPLGYFIGRYIGGAMKKMGGRDYQLWDENDGFFDHLVAPYPSVGALAGRSTVPLDNELFGGKAGTPGGSNGVVGQYGLGVRVPLLRPGFKPNGSYAVSFVYLHAGTSFAKKGDLRMTLPKVALRGRQTAP